MSFLVRLRRVQLGRLLSSLVNVLQLGRARWLEELSLQSLREHLFPSRFLLHSLRPLLQNPKSHQHRRQQQQQQHPHPQQQQRQRQ